MDRAKYADVLAGFEWLSLDVSEHRIPLEDAKRDLEQCKKCRATEISQLGKENAIGYIVSDCPLGTHGFYYALSEAGTREAGRPVFAYHNCGGPAKRLQEIANRLGRRGA